MTQIAPWAAQFGLRMNPFKDTIDTGLFFRARRHEEAAVKIRLGIEDRHALILLDGPSGTGKTLVSQVILRSLDRDRFKPLPVAVFPGMGRGALLEAVLGGLGLAPGRLVHERISQLRQRALALDEEGLHLLVVIDEAHFLTSDALHSLRTLSNLECEREKLITVLLVAEPGLARRLAAPSYASLKGRITFAVTLTPLTLEGMEQYVKYRLLKAGADPGLLPPELYPALHELSNGIPREVNRLLYLTLIEAMTAGQAVGVPLLKAAAGKRGALDG